MPTNEYWRTYTVSNSATTMNNNLLYNPNWSNGVVDATVFGDPHKTYLVYGDPLLKQEAVAKEETPEAWLRRRVEEICWRPA